MPWKGKGTDHRNPTLIDDPQLDHITDALTEIKYALNTITKLLEKIEENTRKETA